MTLRGFRVFSKHCGWCERRHVTHASRPKIEEYWRCAVCAQVSPCARLLLMDSPYTIEHCVEQKCVLILHLNTKYDIVYLLYSTLTSKLTYLNYKLKFLCFILLNYKTYNFTECWFKELSDELLINTYMFDEMFLIWLYNSLGEQREQMRAH